MGDLVLEEKVLTLSKGKEYFCFRYEVGQEAKVIDALVDLASGGRVGFDWFDAGAVAHQLGQEWVRALGSLSK